MPVIAVTQRCQPRSNLSLLMASLHPFRLHSQYPKTTLVLTFTLGILTTLGFKDFYPDLELRFRRWRRWRSWRLDDNDVRERRTRVYLSDTEDPEDVVRKDETTLSREEERDVAGADVLEGAEGARVEGAMARNDGVGEGIESTIGNTPLIRLKALSEALGVDILAKCEFLNGAGNSPKDRVALSIIDAAEAAGHLKPHSGDTIYEGTVGSTGISLATICRARGYKAHICMPSDQSDEKKSLLRKLGAVVSLNEPVGIVDPNHYVNRAKRMAEVHNARGHGPDTSDKKHDEQDPTPTGGLTHNSTSMAESEQPSGLEVEQRRGSRALFADQFETHANYLAHLRGTGPEIYKQTRGHVDAFVAGSGTGGTLSGMALFLKPRLPHCKIVLADPQGSGLYNKVQHGVMFSSTEREGTRRRHQVDSVVEGIGCNRVTANFGEGYEKGYFDGAIRVSDEQAKKMARWLVVHEGVFCGSSSAVNVFAACKVAAGLKDEDRGSDSLADGKRLVAKQLRRKSVVTILCDSGMRHLSRFWADSDIDGEELKLEDVLRDEPS